ncbi:MAG: cell division protein ZapA [Acidobacteria bacterium]|nr:cell division protein ZapA [Acidobacteriota bacterium]
MVRAARKEPFVKNIQVEIFNHSYNVRGDLDEAYVAELARFVDAKMRSVAAATRTVDSLRIAVLAALNIADELHALRQRHAAVEDDLRFRAERCLQLADSALKDSA